MRISVLCTDNSHPVFPYLLRWASDVNSCGHDATIVTDKQNLPGGDILFLVSCSQIVRATERNLYKHCLVLHASDLPKGRGWSPHIWAVLNGETNITVTLLEAEDAVDSGRIWFQAAFDLQGHELLPEINKLLFDAELALMTKAVSEMRVVVPREQIGDPGPHMQRRTPMHSRIDPGKTISDQFDLLRTVDNDRYPAFFEYRGCRYLLKIEKVDHEH
jgi:methionyl-tRNA formyltransferase